jgi:sugar lactone lactonase YvrE
MSRRLLLLTATLGVIAGVASCSSDSSMPGPVTSNTAHLTRSFAPKRPTSLAVARNGDLYIADPSRQQILERHRDGRFTVVVGTGKAGFSGDGGSAKDAEIRNPSGIAVAKDGTLYFADEGNRRVRAISPSGRVRTVVGDGRIRPFFIASGQPARHAAVDPYAVSFGPDGDLYVAADLEVLRLDRSGTLTEMLGGHELRSHQGLPFVRGRAADASADGANGLAFDSRGDLYVSGENTKTLIRIDAEGGVHVVGTRYGFYPRDNGGLVETPSGGAIAMDDLSVVGLSPSGTRTLVSQHELTFPGVGAFQVNGIAVAPTGTIYVDTYAGNGFARKSAIAEITPSGRARLLWSS